MKPINFGISFALIMTELVLRNQKNNNNGYVWNILSLCLYFWGFSVNEIDEIRNAFVEITNGKKHYDESDEKVALMKFVKENQERKLLFIAHMATITASQEDGLTDDQASFMRSLISTFEVVEADALHAIERGADLATAIRFIVDTEKEND